MTVVNVGVVGVGLLGSAVAGRLLAGGFKVAGYDPDPAGVEALAAKGLRKAGSVADAARGADAVFTILPTLEAVETVVMGAGGLLETAPGAVVIQMSTISTELARRLAEAAAEKGVPFLDTPISGTSAMVARGDCTILVAGDEGVAESCQPLFSALGNLTIHLGAPGNATLAKLCTNLLVALNTASLAEAFVLGAKGGLDHAKMLEVISKTAGGSRMADIRGPSMVSGDYSAQMKMELFLKDLRLMAEEAERGGLTLPMLDTARELYGQASGDGRALQDLASVCGHLEKMAGIER
ncbi:MAG: NAD(P)-dependent oxidoreductase [SAR324 cluster bacterium]|nr:NAD(P)-dependent oxidoreductase [SAR324 cluster bacterium]